MIVFENHKSEAKAFDTVREIAEPHGYKIYGISKSPWATILEPTFKQLSQVTDYAVIRDDVVAENKRIAKLILH